MASPRFHIPPEHWNPDALSLVDDEARHCSQVMRRRVGDEVVAFSGAGAWAQCRIAAISKNHVELACEALHAAPPPAVRITLLLAMPKAGNMELIIEKAVELGVNEITPVATDRTVVKLDAAESVRKRDKWQRLALEACKQCGQNWLPQVHAPQPFDNVWSRLPVHDLRLIAAIQDDAMPLKAILQASSLKPQASTLIAIGPEGDFTPVEYAIARSHGCQPITLGPIILRVETAALFCLSVLAHELRA